MTHQTAPLKPVSGLTAWVHTADRKAWRWHRGGGLVIGLAFLCYLASGAVAGIRSLFTPAPSVRTRDSHC